MKIPLATFSLPLAILSTMAICYSASAQTIANTTGNQEKKPVPTYVISIKCAATAKALHQKRLMIGGQDMLEIQKNAYESATRTGTDLQKTPEEISKDYEQELENIHTASKSKKSTITVTSNDPSQKPPSFGDSFAYLELVSQFKNNMPCIYFFGKND